MVVVVTGASSGIGRAIARAFAERRAEVALIARGHGGLAAAAHELAQLGGTPLALPVDVSRQAHLDAAADEVASHFGHIDVWVNSAMVSALAAAHQLKGYELERITEVNYFGTVWGTLAALRHMRPRNRGVIIQLGSGVAYRSIPMQAAYCATKAAVRAFTDSLRSELLADGCEVKLCHVVAPATNTPQYDVMRSKLAGHPSPLGPVYQPEVIARAVVHLAERPVRELWVGASTVKTLIAQKVAPGLVDRLLARDTKQAQVTAALPPSPRDNLLKPLLGDRGAHGPFDGEARSSSVQLWLRLHLGHLAAALAVFGTATALWSWRRS